VVSHPPLQRDANLPAPDADACAASAALTTQIRTEIGAAGGWIPFARYMELALYTPGLGYYSGGAAKFGAAGDFVTAPEISALFGRTLARQVAEVFAASRPQVLEFGAGSGALAATLLAELEQLGTPCERYAILELSGSLRARQEATLQAAVPHLLEHVVWLDALPEAIDGCVLANEVLDAMPAHWVTWHDSALQERGVSVGTEGFIVSERPAGGALREAMAGLATEHELGDGYTSEINLAANAWINALAPHLRHAMALLIDYGFPARTYYHPQRRAGTLRAHYRHHALDDPFYLPGLCDLTTHVDFSAVALAAQQAGLDLDGYTTQAQFLINCGITELLATSDPDDVRGHGALALQANTLLSPAEMGELFKVLAVSRGLGHDWRGFAAGNRLHAL
jgi:SAM-dependent MidA family methyltransferase